MSEKARYWKEKSEKEELERTLGEKPAYLPDPKSKVNPFRNAFPAPGLIKVDSERGELYLDPACGRGYIDDHGEGHGANYERAEGKRYRVEKLLEEYGDDFFVGPAKLFCTGTAELLKLESDLSERTLQEYRKYAKEKGLLARVK